MFAAVGDPEEYPSTQPIMYLADRFSLLEQVFFFFSIRKFYVYNIHLEKNRSFNFLTWWQHLSPGPGNQPTAGARHSSSSPSFRTLIDLL